MGRAEKWETQHENAKDQEQQGKHRQDASVRRQRAIPRTAASAIRASHRMQGSTLFKQIDDSFELHRMRLLATDVYFHIGAP